MDSGDMINGVGLLSNVHIWFALKVGSQKQKFNNISHLDRVQEIEILIGKPKSKTLKAKLIIFLSSLLEERKMSCYTANQQQLYFCTFEKMQISSFDYKIIITKIKPISNWKSNKVYINAV